MAKQTTRMTHPDYNGIVIINEEDFDESKGMIRVNAEGSRIHPNGVLLTKDEIEKAELSEQLAKDSAFEEAQKQAVNRSTKYWTGATPESEDAFMAFMRVSSGGFIKDKGDWTAVGMNHAGEPVPKGCNEDVSDK